MADHADDDKLARMSAAGDREGFQQLVERHQNAIFRFAFHLLRNPHAAEDAAQDTFVKAFRRIESFRPERGSFAAWLFTITRNTCLDALERRKRDHPAVREIPEEIGFEDCSVEGREIFALLDEALDTLDEPFRTTFILAEIEERPLQEIADMDGVALGTVKSRVSRAREKLHAKLNPILLDQTKS